MVKKQEKGSGIMLEANRSEDRKRQPYLVMRGPRIASIVENDPQWFHQEARFKFAHFTRDVII